MIKKNLEKIRYACIFYELLVYFTIKIFKIGNVIIVN